MQQESRFKAGDSVQTVIQRRAENCLEVPDSEDGAHFAETLGRAGFEDLDAEPPHSPEAGRSGLRLLKLWSRRRTFCCSTSQPTTLTLQELNGSKNYSKRPLSPAWSSATTATFWRTSPTRWPNSAASIPTACCGSADNYSTFLEKKEEFLHAQSKRQEALENLVHSEIEWLRRGAKARTRKSKARIDKAGELIDELADLNARTRTATAQIDFSATDRKTKRLIELQNVSYEIGGRQPV